MSTYTLRIVVEGQDKATGPLKGIGGALSNIGQIAGGILAADIFRGIGSAIAGIGANALQAAADMQVLRVGIESLAAREMVKASDGVMTMDEALKLSGGAADNLMNKLREISLISPFEYQDVAQTMRLNMAFGATGDQALGLTQSILDLSSGMGFTNDMLQRTSYNLAQAILQGDMTAQNMRQLKMVGIDLGEVFQSTLGMSLKEVQKGLENGTIATGDLQDAFNSWVNTNFAGAAKRMSKTFQGLKSSFHDLFFFAGSDLLTPALERVTGFLGGIFDKAQTLVEDGTFEKWGEQIGEFVGNILSFPEDLKNTLKGSNLSGLINEFVPEGLREGATNFAESIVQGWENVKIFWDENGESIGAAFRDLGDAISYMLFGESGVQIDFNAILTSLGDGIENATQYLVDHGPEISEFIKNIADKFREFGDWARTPEGKEIITFLAAFGGTVLTISVVGPQVIGIIGGIQSALAALALLGGPVTLLVLAIGLLVGAIVTLGPEAKVALDQLGFIISFKFWEFVNTAATTAGQLVFIVKFKFFELLAGVTTTLGQIGFIINFKFWEAMNNASKWASETVTKVIGWLASIPGKISEKAVEMMTAAANFLGGFFTGLSNYWTNTIVPWAEEKFGWLIDLVNKVYKNESPSKVMREVGFNVGAGFMLGLKDSFEAVEDAFEYPADILIGAARNPAFANAAAGALAPVPTVNGGTNIEITVYVTQPVASEVDVYRMARQIADHVNEAQRR